MNAPRTLLIVLAPLLFSAVPLCAQKQNTRLDLGLTFLEQRSLKAGTAQNFWSSGGSIELGVDLRHGWGIAANGTGLHAASIGGSGLPLSLVIVTFGPRYRWHADRRVSLYGEGLLGEANGFSSIFPAPGGTQSGSNSLALQVGGGIDYRLNHHLAVRLLDAAWLRTQLPNATDNVQNNLRLGAGVVFRFGH